MRVDLGLQCLIFRALAQFFLFFDLRQFIVGGKEFGKSLQEIHFRLCGQHLSRQEDHQIRPDDFSLRERCPKRAVTPEITVIHVFFICHTAECHTFIFLTKLQKQLRRDD